jgi:hypothetical protein
MVYMLVLVRPAVVLTGLNLLLTFAIGCYLAYCL